MSSSHKYDIEASRLHLASVVAYVYVPSIVHSNKLSGWFVLYQSVPTAPGLADVTYRVEPPDGLFSFGDRFHMEEGSHVLSYAEMCLPGLCYLLFFFISHSRPLCSVCHAHPLS